jgi:two-component system sporulation sensor kinase B
MFNNDEFLINMLLILLPLAFMPYIVKYEHNKWLYRTLLTVFFACSIVGAMSFPVEFAGLTYDFRIAPLTLGSIYGGLAVALPLYGVLLAYRYAISSPHQLEYLVSLAPTLLAYIVLSRKYRSFSLAGKCVSAIAASLAARTYVVASYQYLTGGTSSPFDINAILPMLFQCTITGFFVLFVESYKKNFYMQSEIVKSEKMKIVSDMAASVAHEIRNPLTAIRGFIQLLGNGNLTDDKRAAYRQICLEELSRAEMIISDYLSLAKPDPEQIEPIHIRDELTYIANLLQSYANIQSVQIATIFISDKPFYIMGDKFKFRQALLNIGKNAIEAMYGGGLLKLEAAEVPNKVVISVADTGIGMTEEQINRLGTPYYSTKDKGTGLGTMVSFSIIKKMGGTITIKSEPGKGTVYHISFPLHQ